MPPSAVDEKVADTPSTLGGELLKSGLFADAKIKCGSREWNVHKCIIGLKSSYFKKAFTGNFQEAQTNELCLDHELPLEVDCVLKYLYLGKLDSGAISACQKTTCCAGKLSLYLSLFKFADCLDVPTLKEELLTSVDDLLMRLATEIVSHEEKFYIEPEKYFSAERFEDFARAVRTVYSLPLHCVDSIIKPLHKFFLSTRFAVVKDARFKSLMNEIPKMAIDMVNLMLPSGTRQCVVTMHPKVCKECREPSSTYSDIQVMEHGSRSWKSGMTSCEISGRCPSCWEKQQMAKQAK
ncbi:hypothetical protein JX265_011276 [Neoarthrinium moseri]|uniref:BTB domain-containing protein n=1 Tax=Neoarthrinium moseri TaxID=1658444 RepID=A0A9P9WCI9_9PEZI|nr:hypothetical protein JX265_011276 [Neoarthrinium moseri]